MEFERRLPPSTRLRRQRCFACVLRTERLPAERLPAERLPAENMVGGIASWFSGRAATPAHRIAHPHARCATSTSGHQASATLAAYRAFFLTSAYFQFWGSNDHVTKFIEVVHSVSEAAHVHGSLIDVGAAPYNVVGGDVSHLLVYLKQWGCSAGAVHLVGYEPMPHEYMRLVRAVRQEIAKHTPLPGAAPDEPIASLCTCTCTCTCTHRHMPMPMPMPMPMHMHAAGTAPLRLVRIGPTEHQLLDSSGRPCASLRNHPVRRTGWQKRPGSDS